MPPPLPAETLLTAVPEFALAESASLWDNLPAAVASETIRPMESLGQSYGYILYRTQLTGPKSGELTIDEVRQYAQVYINGKPAGTIERRLKQKSVSITVPEGPATLDILVENTGRINFGKRLPDGRAGITGSVSFDDKPLTGWKIFPLPMSTPATLTHWKSNSEVAGPAFHRGTFTLSKAADTYLDTSKLSKGFVWVNGHNLGRTWSIGPQKSLYLPAPWLKAGRNEVVVFDYDTLSDSKLRGVAGPIWP
jgi:beta-galactosidase